MARHRGSFSGLANSVFFVFGRGFLSPIHGRSLNFKFFRRQPLRELSPKNAESVWTDFTKSRVARFSVVQYTKTWIIYHNATKHTKWPENGPTGQKIYQHLPSQDPPNFTQRGIFGLKTYHLASLLYMEARRK
jgi:hypothetical protein